MTFGKQQIIEVCDHFRVFLENIGCDTSKIDAEWLTLKSYIIPLIQNQDYLEIWRKVSLNNELKLECKNVLHLFELMVLIPFTVAKVERLFSPMNRIETTIRNRMSWSRLDVCLGEDGPSIGEFNPDPALVFREGSKVICWATSYRKFDEKARLTLGIKLVES